MSKLGEANSGPNRVRLGMVGGGQGAFIGAVHRIAARIDDEYDLCAGVLSSNPQRALASACEIGLPEDRSYENVAAMLAAESARDDGIEVVSVVTPNNAHFSIAKACLEAGTHVICDKPITVTCKEADELIELAKAQNRILAVTYNYSGYPMIRQAREMINAGELGDIRVVQAEYAQDWLTEAIEQSGNKQAAWRTDPSQSGAGGCIGDIGTHAYHLACFVTGLELESLCADLSTFVSGRKLDDNVNVLMRFKGGAKGSLWASQVAPGNENNLTLRVYGTRGGLSWRQECPNELEFSPFGESTRRITRGSTGAGSAAAAATRIPAGHPEGYLEGFANLYTEIAAAIRAARSGTTTAGMFPRGEDGRKGVAFVEAAVKSSNGGAAWVNL
ncbi:MAG TPA: Gfo/Idh/MocA family oxidoreductase [Woeseiaceae bacterium]|nr:Gfo/Idh/MocA family oxidoreductase [Woeseiaceae bacterium]